MDGVNMTQMQKINLSNLFGACEWLIYFNGM